MKIVIIDSGIDLSHKIFDKDKISGFSISNCKILEDYCDKLGHGTGVASIIARLVPDVELICIKVFHDIDDTDEGSLIIALKYVLENISCDIIHISAGIVQSGRYSELEFLCDMLDKKGVLIVSSVDNNGAVSYPAAFDCVIGVAASKDCKKDREFIFVENSFINFFAKGIAQTVLWSNNAQMYVTGSSFASPYITAELAKIIQSGITGKSNIINAIKDVSKSKLYLEDKHPHFEYKNTIKKAVIFPFNKEMHSLMRADKLLPFTICDVFNFKHLGNVGKNTNELLKINAKNYRIRNIEKINWADDFDAFILGHCDEMIDITGYDIRKNIIENCYKHRKNIFAFDSKYIEKNDFERFNCMGLSLHVPNVSEEQVPSYLLDRLHVLNTPIICVLGTSSRQGKFTLQLQLRENISSLGYKVGQLGTEPSSELFGFDKVFPSGYNSEVKISGGKVVSVVNLLMKQIEDMGYDLIIAGGQSGAIPFQIRSLNDIPYNAHEFLMGVNPDIVLLCVNYDDDIGYIIRNIKYIEGLVDSKVLGIVLFPLKQRVTWSGLYLVEDEYNRDEIKQKMIQISDAVGIKTFLNGERGDMESLAKACIEYFINDYNDSMDVI